MHVHVLMPFSATENKHFCFISTLNTLYYFSATLACLQCSVADCFTALFVVQLDVR